MFTVGVGIIGKAELCNGHVGLMLEFRCFFCKGEVRIRKETYNKYIGTTLNILAEGVQLEQVNSFKYLGVMCDGGAVKEVAITERIAHYSRNVGLIYR